MYPPPLPAEEQIALCARAQAGDLVARNRLVETTMRLVVNRAHAMRRLAPGVDLADLASEGALGVIAAIEAFDPSKATRFVTYARSAIDNSIRKAALRARGISSTAANHGPSIARVADLVAAGVARHTAIEQVAAENGTTPATLEAAFAAFQRKRFVSLETPLTSDGDGRLGDVLAIEQEHADQALEEHEGDLAIQRALDRFRRRLPPRERVILDRVLLADEDEAATLQELGDAFGVSKERVRQLKRRLERRLHSTLRRNRTVRSAIGQEIQDWTQYMRRRRAQHKALGLCSACLQPASPGMRMCQDHLAKYRASGMKWRRSKGGGPKPSVLLTYNGETLSASEWSRRTGLLVSLILYRHHAGWAVERVLSTAKKPGMPKKERCLRGHDIAVVGRYSGGVGSCRACVAENYQARRQASAGAQSLSSSTCQ